MLLPLVAFRVSGLFSPGRSLLQYHGAEHMAVNAIEAGGPLNADRAAVQSRIHPRCGTTFAVWVILLSSRLNRGAPSAARGLLTGAVVVSLAYELLRFGAIHRSETWVKLLFGPTWKAQLLTTSAPTRDQLEVACAALNAVVTPSDSGESVSAGTV